MLCPRNTRSSSKSKRFVAMKRVSPFRLSAKNCTYRKAPSITGETSTVPFRHLPIPYTPAEFDILVRRLQKAEHKLSIIQLSGYLSKVPLQDKLATLEHFHNEMSDLYSVHELCEALNVSRGTFYNHIFRRADRSKYESEKA